MSQSSLKHVEYFASTLGARGSTTEGERRGHQYAKQTLEGLGYPAQWEEFYSPTSGWHPFALAFALMLLATALFVSLGGKANSAIGALAAFIIAFITVVSFFMQITFRDNPLRWFLPVAKSQNVWALAKAKGNATKRVVLTGHVDTHRTALAMQSELLWKIFQLLTTVSAVANIGLLVLFAIGIVNPDPLLRNIAAGLSVILLVGLVFTLQPDLSPYVKGGNDNATGAATVLAFAERLRNEPLQNTDVFLINTGCEEVGCYGVIDWIKRHAATDAPNAYYVVLDNIGGKGSEVNYLLEETVLLPVRSDAGLVAVAQSVARQMPELGATAWRYKGLYSEMSLCAVNGQKALGLLNFDPKTKMPPRFHTAADDFQNVDPQVLDKSEKFAWAILQHIDRM